MSSIIKVDTIQNQSGANIISESSNTITVGASGDTITVPTGASLTVPSGGLSGQNYPAFEAQRPQAVQVVSDNTSTKVQFSTENFDTDNCYDNSTNYRFTPTTAGKYFTYTKIGSDTSAGNMLNSRVQIYKNGSLYTTTYVNMDGNNGEGASPYTGQIVDMNGSSDYLEIYVIFETGDASNPTAAGNATSPNSMFGAYKIIE